MGVKWEKIVIHSYLFVIRITEYYYVMGILRGAQNTEVNKTNGITTLWEP